MGLTFLLSSRHLYEFGQLTSHWQGSIFLNRAATSRCHESRGRFGKAQTSQLLSVECPPDVRLWCKGGTESQEDRLLWTHWVLVPGLSPTSFWWESQPSSGLCFLVWRVLRALSAVTRLFRNWSNKPKSSLLHEERCFVLFFFFFILIFDDKKYFHFKTFTDNEDFTCSNIFQSVPSTTSPCTGNTPWKGTPNPKPLKTIHFQLWFASLTANRQEGN